MTCDYQPRRPLSWTVYNTRAPRTGRRTRAAYPPQPSPAQSLPAAGRPCPWSTATHDARHPPHAQRARRPCLNQFVARHEDFRPGTTPTSSLDWFPQHLKLASPIVYVGLRASPHTATDFSSMRRLSVHHPRKNKLRPAEAQLVRMTRTTH